MVTEYVLLKLCFYYQKLAKAFYRFSQSYCWNQNQKYNILETKVKMWNIRREILNHNLKGFVLRCWMGQSAEQSRDDFKDVRGEEDLSHQKNSEELLSWSIFGSVFLIYKIHAPQLTMVNLNLNLSSASSVSTLMPRPYFFYSTRPTIGLFYLFH